jgi:integrase
MACFVSPRKAILSIQSVRRELRGKLGRCWDCIKAWQFETAPPRPEDLDRAFFAFTIAEGLAATKDRDVLAHFAIALLIRVGFECLLRPGELLKLKVKDLRLPRSQYEPPVCVVTLRDAKNKSSLGRFQFAMFTDPSLVAWLAWFTADFPGELHLWPDSSGKFSKHLNRVLLRLGLGRLPLTPGCLRPGGATRLFLARTTSHH